MNIFGGISSVGAAGLIPPLRYITTIFNKVHNNNLKYNIKKFSKKPLQTEFDFLLFCIEHLFSTRYTSWRKKDVCEVEPS